jgi:hypothetical protein
MINSLSFHGCSTVLHSLDDVLIARATAKIAFKQLANFNVAGVRMVVANVHGTHDHARRAKAALQAVALFEGGLHGVHGAVGLRHPFNGGDLCALGLRQKHIARLDSTPVDVDRTSAALRGIATHVCPREFEVLSQGLNEQRVGGGIDMDAFSIDLHLNLHA